jgi:hypothetical protein
LKKIIGRSSLTYDELNTILIEVEALINARPITYIYDDDESISYPLCPSHLIYGRRITAMPSSEHYEVVSTYHSLRKDRVIKESYCNNLRSNGVGNICKVCESKQ